MQVQTEIAKYIPAIRSQAKVLEAEAQTGLAQAKVVVEWMLLREE